MSLGLNMSQMPLQAASSGLMPALQQGRLHPASSQDTKQAHGWRKPEHVSSQHSMAHSAPGKSSMVRATRWEELPYYMHAR